MSKVKYYIQTTATPRTEAAPSYSGEFTWKREKDNVYYRHKLKDSMRFSSKEDYDFIMAMSADECGLLFLTIERECEGVYAAYWFGTFTFFDCKVNEDKCFIEVKPKTLDAFYCFDQRSKTKINVYQTPVKAVTSIGGTYETHTSTNVAVQANCNTYLTMWFTPHVGNLPGGANEWCVRENLFYSYGQLVNLPDCAPGTLHDIDQFTTWHREVVDWPCAISGTPTAPTYGSGWSLLSDDCGSLSTSKWFRCPAAAGTILGGYNTGRLLTDVIQKVLDGMACNLQLKSDFFNVNPDGTAPNNLAYTYAQNYLHNLTFHQKSDIKRKTATNPSSGAYWDIKPAELFSDLSTIFNVAFDIQAGNLILEHVSFFAKASGLDLRGKPVKKEYDFNQGENLKTESFYWADEECSTGFKAVDITYDCGEEEKERRCKLISTDLKFIENESNEEKVDDKGFVLVSTTQVLGKNVIINDNTPLAWVNLHTNLHMHGRAFKSGTLNGAATQFLSWTKYKKAEPIQTPLCCETFDPNATVLTDMGEGDVGEATYNVYNNRIELQLNY